METKRFDLRTILSVTTGRLLTKSQGPKDNGIGDLYELLGWMTNDSPFTHQLPRFGDECKPWLLRWFPELAIAGESAAMAALDELLKLHGGEKAGEGWFATIRLKYRLEAEYDVPRIPQDDHEHKNPYDEMVTMRGTDEGIVIVTPPTPHE